MLTVVGVRVNHTVVRVTGRRWGLCFGWMEEMKEELEESVRSYGGLREDLRLVDRDRGGTMVTEERREERLLLVALLVVCGVSVWYFRCYAVRLSGHEERVIERFVRECMSYDGVLAGVGEIGEGETLIRVRKGTSPGVLEFYLRRGRLEVRGKRYGTPKSAYLSVSVSLYGRVVKGFAEGYVE